MNVITRSLLSTLAAGVLVGAPISLSPASADQPPASREPSRQHDRDDACEGYRGAPNDRNDRGDRCNDRQFQDRQSQRDDQRDDRKEWRDTRDNSRWDGAQHNGYYSENKWHYGPPTNSNYNSRGFSLGYHPWQAGDRLGYFNRRYAEVNYRLEHLQKPARGYRWVRDDRGIFIMAKRSNGLIRVVLNRNRH